MVVNIVFNFVIASEFEPFNIEKRNLNVKPKKKMNKSLIKRVLTRFYLRHKWLMLMQLYGWFGVTYK